jgi:hypothetical protein
VIIVRLTEVESSFALEPERQQFSAAVEKPMFYCESGYQPIEKSIFWPSYWLLPRFTEVDALRTHLI